jgi:DNA repair protein RadC
VDKHLNLLAVETIGRGDVAGVRINTAAILCRGHALKASGFFLVHNHPSGDPRPSATDIRTTNILRRLSHELDLPLLEHFIIAGDDLATVGGL